uniref:BTB domain-containing protein n=1 Tax=Biomphalaria glabrata TaxID=6526 RepID=A0A2C9M7N6_BIOGL
MNSCEDIPHKNISLAIIQCIGKFRNNNIYEDFQVNIEGETIRCHLFILASCSEFFSSLIRSNMKEKQEMKVDLQNIPMKTFQLILKTLYTGCELLTKDNVLKVWSAVHQLQIHFLVQHCEDFILENISLEILETYKKHAEFLQSERVSEGIFKYMLQNFMILRSTGAFLRLQFEDLLRLIESDSLVVTSEDLVLQSVYEWINFGESSFVTVKNEADSTLKTSSKDTSLTEFIVHSSKYDDSGKDVEAIDVSPGIVSELKEATEE